MKTCRTQQGFSLVEVVVAAAIFVVVALGFYQVYATIIETTTTLRLKNMALFIANSQIELMRNAPYDEVGLVSGLPSGVFDQFATVTMGGIDFSVTRYIRSIDEPFDGTVGGLPQDLSPADNKAVTIEVECPVCADFTPISITARIAPLGLETASGNGAMLIRVFDAAGQPIQGARVEIYNDSLMPVIDYVDTTNAEGELLLVDAPPGVETYRISVSKLGYSTERTYAPGEDGVLNPVKPNLTAAEGEIAQAGFAIDVLSDVAVSTVTPTCNPAGLVGFQMTGSKLLSADPDFLKHDLIYQTNTAGLAPLTGLEWDTYTLTASDETYAIIGSNPLNPIAVDPGQNQDILLVVEPADPYMLSVAVLDAESGLPVASSTVALVGGGYDEELLTDVGVVQQTDWGGGGGQSDFTNERRFYDSTNIDVTSTEGQAVLQAIAGSYQSSGVLESSTFDLGNTGLLRSFTWAPLSQPTGEESLRFQLATNNDNATWNFVGPDGSSSSYYTATNRTLYPGHSGNRYLRYRAYLSTTEPDTTPLLADTFLTFTAACVPPGQVTFMGLPGVDSYELTVSGPGYDQYSDTVEIEGDHEYVTILLEPST